MEGREKKELNAEPGNEDLINTPASVEKKEKILAAAERLFGDLGFEAVSTRLLAKEAGVNMAMLAYYFGSKEKLFRSMIQRRTEDGRTKLQELLSTGHTPSEKIDLVIDMYVNKLFDSGRMHALFQREISLLQRTTISELICQSLTDAFKSIIKIIKEGQVQGVFRKVDMEFTVISMISTISYVVNSPAMTRLVFNLGEDEVSTKNDVFRKRIKKHLKDMIHKHLEFGMVVPLKESI